MKKEINWKEVRKHAQIFREMKILEILRKQGPKQIELFFLETWAERYDNHKLKKAVKEKWQEMKK